jgi:RNA polymerase subunit RPABC4/transcription elongation factor Spt4
MTYLLLEWPGGSIEQTLKLAGLIVGSYLLVLWLSAVVWVYRDIRSRTGDAASQVVAVLLVAVFNVPGLIVYLVIRPQSTLSDAYERSIETEAMLHELQMSANSCQSCSHPIDDDFNVCPYCRTLLREGCRNCGRAIRTSWLVCPYCAVERVQRQPAGARSEARDESLLPPRRVRQQAQSQPAAGAPTPTNPPPA